MLVIVDTALSGKADDYDFKAYRKEGKLVLLESKIKGRGNAMTILGEIKLMMEKTKISMTARIH